MKGIRIAVSGIVQGVGFRPFVYNLATRLGLAGEVRNTSAGVSIALLGEPSAMEAFQRALQHDAPRLAHIARVSASPLASAELTELHARTRGGFTITTSASQPGAFVAVSPDVAICADCLAELLDPADRRYRYPFINCTNCGPRYTIIRDIPYDRPATTMADFALCADCRAEYENPADRRFHAQPNACPVCGPRLWFTRGDGQSQIAGPDAILAAQHALAAGEIVAIKGIGGFHLACDAANAHAVQTLRARKSRPAKPFALMAASTTDAARIVQLPPAAQDIMTSPAHPIVLLPRRADCHLPDAIAPGNYRLGVMLPYAPLHHLLFQPADAIPNPPFVLVMTSGNLSEEPIAISNEEAQARLADLADAFLLHDRPIHIACDDSVVAYSSAKRSNLRCIESRPESSLPAHQDASEDAAPQVIPIRRSRGYAPMPITLPFPIAPVLAVGGELKNTLCVARDHYAFLSGHIGDLANLETQRAFEQAEDHMRCLFRVAPARIACDLHPGYLSTHWAASFAQRTATPLARVQHHHAHIAALMAEHQLPVGTEIIGVAMDGTGYGPDGTIWGGEFLVAGYANYRRVGRLRPLPLPGGDASIHRPYRMALAALWAFGMTWDEQLPPVAACPPAERSLLVQQLERNFNCVPTSSMGRLFDAIAALMGLCTTASFEAQGAIQLETEAHAFRSYLPRHVGRSVTDASPLHAASPFGCYEVDGDTHARELGQIDADHVEFELDTEPLVRAVTAAVTEIQSQPRHRSVQERQLQDTDALARVAYRVHDTVSAMIETGCREARRRYGHDQVGLTGGVFQNALLLELTAARLARAGFQVLTHRLVPPNDGGLALGQAVIAGCRALEM